MNQTVIGVFDTKNQAQSAREALKNADFDQSSIDVSSYGEHGTTGDRYRDDSDSVSSFFGNLFGTDDDRTKTYSDVAGRGTVITVHTKNMADAKRAAAIMDRYEAIDMDDRYSQYSTNKFDADKNRSYLNDRLGDVNGKIEVVKEDIAVGKREVETGGVTVRSRIVEKPVTETLRLRQEEVFVKRTPVDRAAKAGDFENETISLRETAEEAVVEKSARVVEEIEVGKKVNIRTEQINETVRETEVDIDKKAHKDVKTHGNIKK